MAKSGTQSRGQKQASRATAPDEQALKLLRDFSRESRQTVKKPIRPRFGNRYVAPLSD